MPSIQSRIAPKGWKPGQSFLVLAGIGAPPVLATQGPFQGLLPANDMAEGAAPVVVPRSPVFVPIFRPTPLPVIAPAAKSTAVASGAGTTAASSAKVFVPSVTPPANLAATATGTGTGVVVAWTPPAANGSDSSGVLLANLVSFQVLRGPLNGGIGAASVIATVTNSGAAGKYSYTDPNGLTSQFEYYVRPVTAAGNANATKAVTSVVAISSTQVPPTGGGGSGTGQILDIAVHGSGGTGYQVGDSIGISGGAGGTLQVTDIDPGGLGHVVGIALVSGGTGYTVATEATTGGSGTGLQVDVTSVA